MEARRLLPEKPKILNIGRNLPELTHMSLAGLNGVLCPFCPYLTSTLPPGPHGLVPYCKWAVGPPGRPRPGLRREAEGQGRKHANRQHIPLQFLAILNIFAALAYISHASSILDEPLRKNKKENA